MSPGIETRLARLRVPGSDTYLCIPMDHGVSIGPVDGITDLPATLDALARGGASCVVFQKGLARFVPPYAQKLGFILHISASTASSPDTNDKVTVCSAEEAVRLGADAISTHTNFGSLTESQQLVDLAAAVEEAHRYGLPVLAMAYPRGPKVDDPYDAVRIAAAARAAAELGADLVKCPYSGDLDSFRDIVRGVPVPVLIAGGPKLDDDKRLLQVIADATEAGAKGVSIGRNVFQHRHPDRIVAAIRAILVDGEAPNDAERHLAKPLPA